MADRTCSIDGCDRPVKGRGWCDPHYKRWWRNGDPLAGRQVRSWAGVACSVDGCRSSASSRGWCNKHYLRWWQYGDPLVELWSERPHSDRFWALVSVDTDPCWMWNGAKSQTGYGRFRCEGRTLQAHRFAYEDKVGPIPKGLELDHLCRNRACVNPAHLEPVSHAENNRRAWAYRRAA